MNEPSAKVWAAIFGVVGIILGAIIAGGVDIWTTNTNNRNQLILENQKVDAQLLLAEEELNSQLDLEQQKVDSQILLAEQELGAQLQLSKRELESSIVLKIIETDSITVAKQNLLFIIDSGLIQDEKGLIREAIEENIIPVLPSSRDSLRPIVRSPLITPTPTPIPLSTPVSVSPIITPSSP